MALPLEVGWRPLHAGLQPTFTAGRKNVAIEMDPGGGSRPDAEAFAILDALSKLPEAYRETLVLRLVEGMTGPEIAARTGLTPRLGASQLVSRDAPAT